MQRGKSLGGLAIPNPYIYFLAAQLQHLKGWGETGGTGAIGGMIGTLTGVAPPLGALELGAALGPPRLLPTISMILRVWSVTKSLLGVMGHTPFTPLWRNPCLPEFFRLEGFSPWMHRGIRALADILNGDTLLTFPELQTKHDLPHTYFYQYLQLRHAFDKQKEGGPLTVSGHTLLLEIGRGGSRRGVISLIYNVLLGRYCTDASLQVRSKWENDVGPLTDDQWTDILSDVPQLSLSETHRLSQLYLLHRAYRTPHFLHKIGWRPDSTCPRCSDEGADLMHMFWGCRELEEYWRGVVNVITDVYAVTLPLTPMVCVLGCFDSEQLDETASLGVKRILYQARKTIAAHWKDSAPPTVQEYIGRMNAVIRLEWGVYVKRKAGAKFEKLWGRWIDTPGLPTSILSQLGRRSLRLLVGEEGE